MSRPLVIVALLLLSETGIAQPTTQPATAPAAGPSRTWTYSGRGNWTAVSDTAPTIQRVENPTLDRVDRLLAAHRFGEARRLVLAWLKKHRKAPDRDRGVFLLAEAYYQYGDRLRAFYHLDELLDLHPESRLFYPAMEKQFEIADKFLRGYKRRLFGIPMLGAEEEAIDMLFRIQERAPGSPLAERALVRTADHYYSRGQYDLAADAYAAYARSYPRSPVIPRVKLRQAFASLAQFRGRYYDVTPLIDARAQLQALQAAFPDFAEQEGIAAVLARVDKSMAGKLYWTADFYRRTHEPRAAAYTYRYLITRFPTSPEADRARQHLDHHPQWAHAPPPPPRAPASPSSAPSSAGSCSSAWPLCSSCS
jgi:outer membrane assembly lipoprotein YfiO